MPLCDGYLRQCQPQFLRLQAKLRKLEVALEKFKIPPGGNTSRIMKASAICNFLRGATHTRILD